MTVKYIKNGQVSDPIVLPDVMVATMATEMRYALRTGQIEGVEIFDESGASVDLNTL